jgi:hypothetical protein
MSYKTSKKLIVSSHFLEIMLLYPIYLLGFIVVVKEQTISRLTIFLTGIHMEK